MSLSWPFSWASFGKRIIPSLWRWLLTPVDDDFVNVVALIWENFPQGHFSLLAVKAAMARGSRWEILKEVPSGTRGVLLAASVVHEPNVLTILCRKSNGVGKADSVGGPSPCAGVVNRVVRTERDTRHPCVTDSGFLSAMWASVAVLLLCFLAVVYVFVYFAHNFKKYSLFQGQSQPLNVTFFTLNPRLNSSHVGRLLSGIAFHSLT